MISESNTLFGGPDKSKNILRDTLLADIANVPINGKILWMCYYFNEIELLEALITASKRGVKIEIIIDGNPRCPEINRQSISILEQHPNIKLTAITSKPIWEYIGIKWHAHMHSKCYYFSHPEPHAYIGSYNPTSDTQYIDDSLIQKIGDHTISHNVLVKLHDVELLNAILDYFTRMKSTEKYKWTHAYITNIKSLNYSNCSISFLPKAYNHPINQLFEQKDNKAKIKCAISHLKGPNILKPLIKARKLGKQVELIVDSTQRRVDSKLLSQLKHYNIEYKQIANKEHVLMHNKFIIYHSDTKYCVLFGSFNWSLRSWRLNHEIIVTTFDKSIISAFQSRWKELLALP